MQITKQTNYALRALVYCAANAPRHCRVADIAHAYGVSELSLFKYIKPLVDGGLLETVRGRHGGIRLARPAETISMREVVETTEESFALAECFEEGADCPLVGNCDINAALAEALHAFLEVLARYSVADLAERQSLLRDLLAIPDADGQVSASA